MLHAAQPATCVPCAGCVVTLGGESEAMAFLKQAAPALKVVFGVLKGLVALQRAVTGL